MTIAIASLIAAVALIALTYFMIFRQVAHEMGVSLVSYVIPAHRRAEIRKQDELYALMVTKPQRIRDMRRNSAKIG